MALKTVTGPRVAPATWPAVVSTIARDAALAVACAHAPCEPSAHIPAAPPQARSARRSNSLLRRPALIANCLRLASPRTRVQHRPVFLDQADPGRGGAAILQR